MASDQCAPAPLAATAELCQAMPRREHLLMSKGCAGLQQLSRAYLTAVPSAGPVTSLVLPDRLVAEGCLDPPPAELAALLQLLSVAKLLKAPPCEKH